jgi:transposase
LEDANVKLDSVASDVLGKGVRRMLEALIAGERDVEVMADMALTWMRPKIAELRLALEGRFSGHHALMAGMHLRHIDELSALIDSIEEEVDRRLVPFAEAARRLQMIPGIGKRTAEVVIAEIGVDMSRFPTAAHLASWAGLCPGNHESAGKRRSGRALKGNAALRSALCEAAWCAARTPTTTSTPFTSAAYPVGRRHYRSRLRLSTDTGRPGRRGASVGLPGADNGQWRGHVRGAGAAGARRRRRRCRDRPDERGDAARPSTRPDG